MEEFVRLLVLTLGIMVVSLLVEVKGGRKVATPSTCDIPAIYNFGDSNSDTGGIAAAFYPMPPPCGETFFKRPVGRASDGRLIIDFIAERLGLPYLSAYLDSIKTIFSNGANFATGGATITRINESWFEANVSPFSLEIQVEQFDQFKARTTYFYNNAKDSSDRLGIPLPDNFGRAIYTLDIGQNDIAAGFRRLGVEGTRTIIPDIINQFGSLVQMMGTYFMAYAFCMRKEWVPLSYMEQLSNNMISNIDVNFFFFGQQLYGKGARAFWVHNTGPLGCIPLAHVKVHDTPPEYLDETGCVKDTNDICKEFNKQLRERVDQLRVELSEAAITYVDMYEAKYQLIRNAKDQGFEDRFTICCGYHDMNNDVWCGNKGKINGTEIFAGSCEDPSKVISWDGVHYTEAANMWLASRILNGSFSDPPISITQTCPKHV